MATRYTVKRTSAASASVADVVLPSSDAPSDARTRKVARPEIVANEHARTRSVKVSLLHQRKGALSGQWEDCPAFNLATLKAGEEVRLRLDTSETWHLYEALRDLYAVGAKGIPYGNQELLVLDAASTHIIEGKAREVVMHFEQHGAQLWDVIDQMKPHLLDVYALHKLHTARQQVVQEFKARMKSRDWPEPQWQRFFETNTWIFGHSLAYCVLGTVQRQPSYGGATVAGTGAQRGDMLLASQAAVRFTVLVEIKRPDSDLLEPGPYRNKVYRPSIDLGGGVAQVQSNCRTWVTEGANQEDNRELLEREGIHTYEPKGILVIGDCAQLDNRHKKASFEPLRRNTHNPEIITYDEMLARAEFLVATTAEKLAEVSPQ